MRDDDLYRIRKLAGLVKENDTVDLTEAAEINEFVAERMDKFISQLLENTVRNLDAIAQQIEGIEMSKLNESNMTKLSNLKSLVKLMAQIKK